MAHLSIHGEFITDYVRGLVLEGNAEKAWITLEECLLSDEGDVPYSVIANILNGAARLEGVNDCFLVEEQNIEYQNELRYTYAGCVQVGGMWYRPILVVPSYSSEAVRTASTFHSVSRALQADRHIFCDDNGVIESWVEEWEELFAQWQLFRLRGHVRLEKVLGFFVLWDVCPARPLWFKGAPKNFEAAFVEFLEAGKNLSLVDENDLLSFYEDFSRSNFYDDDQFDQWELLTLTQKLVNHRNGAKKSEEQRQLQEEINRRAGSDVLELRVASKVYTVPRAPFIHWALRKTKFTHFAPNWEVVCPSGMKMANDDPYHSDWMLGAGIPLHKSYDRDLVLAATDLAAKVQEEICGTSTYVLAGADGYHHGSVGESILVIPHLGVEYAEAALNPKVRVIIAEEGGALSHLVSVGREARLCVLRVENATSLFPLGTLLEVNQETGKVSVL